MPQDDPIHDAQSTKELKDAIYNQIARSHVIVIPTGMYTSYSKWIEKEIDGAKQYEKPILAVDPWGQERTADIVTSNADESVGWNAKSIVCGILKLFKG